MALLAFPFYFLSSSFPFPNWHSVCKGFSRFFSLDKSQTTSPFCHMALNVCMYVSWLLMFGFYLLFYPSPLITGHLKSSHSKGSELPGQILISNSNPFIHGWSPSIDCWSLALYTWGTPLHPWTHSPFFLELISYAYICWNYFIIILFVHLSVKSLRTNILPIFASHV